MAEKKTKKPAAPTAEAQETPETETAANNTPEALEGAQAAAETPPAQEEGKADQNDAPAVDKPDDGQEAPAATNDTPKPEEAQGGTQAAAGTPPEKDKPPEAPPFVLRRVLKVSKPLMRGEDVAALHAALIKAGFHSGKDSTEGIFGAQTAAAVRHFQSMNRLIVSGRVEKFTAKALGWTLKEAPTATPKK